MLANKRGRGGGWHGHGEGRREIVASSAIGERWPGLKRSLYGGIRKKERDICLTKVERGIEILVSLVGYRGSIYTGVVCYLKYTKCGKSRAISKGYCYSSQVRWRWNIFSESQFIYRLSIFCRYLPSFWYLATPLLYTCWRKNCLFYNERLTRCDNLVIVIDSVY